MKQITDRLFMELVKYHLWGADEADSEYIRAELEKKMYAAARRQAYTERIIERKKTEP